ncbi:MAG: T9SS type A sorting domain-containing protein [Bacteroidota bacterium]
MKLKLFVLLGFVCCSFSLYGQGWLKDDALWVYELKYGSYGSIGYEEITHKSDTILQDKVCKVYQRIEFFGSSPATATQTEVEDMILCEQNDSIFIYEDEIDSLHLLYDFSDDNDVIFSVFTDSLHSPHFEYDCAHQYVFAETDREEVEIDGVMRRVQYGLILESLQFFYQRHFMVIEGVGVFYDDPEYSSSDDPMPFGYINMGDVVPCFPHSGKRYTPRCYFDNEISIQEAEVCNPLGVFTSTRKIADQHLKIYPNPISHALPLTIETDFPLRHIQLINTLGQKFDMPLHKELDLSHLPKGVYWLQVQTPQGMLQQQIIKQ